MSSRSKPLNPRTLPLWSRMAVVLGFLAMLSALLAPVSMMARDVQTGKFGGVCSAAMSLAVMSTAGERAVDATPAGDAQAASHCDLCGSPALASPPPAVGAIPCAPGQQVAAASLPTPSGTAVQGLPFSRGPPEA
ncbi:MAG: hypothetical protein EOO25_14670 [Comamonadaceae bacterium]|nr:MAG: hypothetical protein EOO25_14670 [Comamonadaceae bacterium]